MLETSAAGRAAVWGVIVTDAALIAADNLTAFPHVFGGADRVMHAYTAFAVTLWTAVFLWRTILTGIREHPLLVAAIVAGFGLALGAAWEIAEWGFHEVVLGRAIAHQTDTILDLTMDLVGAGVAGLASLWLLWPAARARPSP